MLYPVGLKRHASVLLLSLITGAGATATLAQDDTGQGYELHRVEVAVAAQPLKQALALFSRQTGLLVQLTGDVTEGIHASPVNGRMTASKALSVLLTNTGLDFHFADKNTVVLQPQHVAVGRDTAVLPAITVTSEFIEDAWGAANGYVATHSATGTKTDAAITEIPQSISVVTRQDMDDRGTSTVMDAVAYSAGVHTEPAGIDSRVDDIQVRGFDAGSWSNNMYLDGLRLPKGGQWSTPQVDAYGLERVEIIKGPAAVLYGQVTPGGLVNMVAKRPTVDQVNEVGLTVSSFNQVEGTLDVGGSLSEDDAVIGRFVASVNDGDSQVDETELGRVYLAPSIKFLIGDSSDLTLLSYYQKDDGGSAFQFLPTKGMKYPTEFGYIGHGTFLGEPDWNVYERTQWAAGYDFSHYFNDVWSFRQNAKYSHLESLFKTVVSATFDNDGLLLDNRTMNRRAVQGDGDLDAITIDNQLKANFSIGEWTHDAMVGVDYYSSEWSHLRQGVGGGLVQPIDVYDPIYSGAEGFDAALFTQSDYDAEDKQQGLYLQNLMAYNNWRVTAGIRRDFFDYRLSNAGLEEVNEDDIATTWRTGVTYLFDNGIAPYVSYATSFEPMNGLDSNNIPQKPTEGDQVEMGVKYQPTQSNSLYTVSVFELSQTNLPTTDLSPSPLAECVTEGTEDTADDDPTDCTIQTGETRTRGVELEAKTWVLEGFSVSGSYTYLDTKVVEDNSGLEGKRKEFVPRHSAGLWLDYKWRSGTLAGLAFGTGARYTDSTYGDAANSIEVPSYTLYDMSLRYDMLYAGMPGLMVSLAGRNLEDKQYLSSCNPFGCSYGSARVISASAQYRW